MCTTHSVFSHILTTHNVAMASTPSLIPNSISASLVTPVDVDRLIKIEEESIKKSQNRILQLKTQRNMLSPICRIPQELLGEILVALASSYAADYTSPCGRCWPYWTVVTEVCRYWRSVSLRTPRMWACIPLTYYDKSNLLSIFMARSGHAPLTLIQPLHSPGLMLPLTQKLKMIISGFRRTQEASLVIGERVLRLSEQTPGGLDAPYLRTLALCIEPTISPAQTSFATIANASWPQLSSLQCIYGSFALVQALTRPSLTRLKVEHVLDPQPAITWVNFLRTFPYLEELTIIESIAHPGAPTNTIPRPT